MNEKIIHTLVGFAALFGCQSGTGPSTATKSPTNSARTPEQPWMGIVQASQELRSPVRDPMLAFHSEGNGFDAAFGAHRVRVANGHVQVTPNVGARSGVSVDFETGEVRRGEIAVGSQLGLASVAKVGEVHIDRGSFAEEIENREDGVEQRWMFATEPVGTGDLVVSVDVSGYDGEVIETDHGLHFMSDGLGVRYSSARWVDAVGQAFDLPMGWENGHIAIRVPQQLMDVTVYPAVLDPTVESEEGVDDVVTGYSGANAVNPSIASRWDGLLAVWSDQRTDSKNPDIYAARITPTGTVLDFRGFPVNSDAGAQSTPVVARIGDNYYLVAWNNVGAIGAATVDDGNVVTQLGNVGPSGQLPAIAAYNTTAVLAWQNGSDIDASTFSGGAFGAPTTVVTGTAAAHPAVAASASGFLVVWYETNTGIEGQLLSASGAPTGAAFLVNANGSGEPAAAFDGTDYVVSFDQGSDVYAARVTTAGAVLDPNGVGVGTGTGVQNASTVSCDSASCVVIWSDSRTLSTTGFDIYGQRVDFTLALVGGNFAIQTASRYQQTPAVVLASAGWMSIWEDERTGGQSMIVGTGIDSSGSVLNPAGFVVNTSYNNEANVRTSNAPNTQLVLWSDSRTIGNDIIGVRYNGVGGARIDSTPVTISDAANDQSLPAVSFDGTQFMAVWTDSRGADRDIYAARLGTSGGALDSTGIAVSTALTDQRNPDIASAPGSSLAVWMDRRNGNFDIYGAVISANGTLTAVDVPICVAANDQNTPAVVFDAADNVYIVIWSDNRSGTADIYAARVDTSGSVLDPNGVLISNAANGQFNPDIAISGSTIMAVWDDRRTDSFGDIYGSRLSATGSLTSLDPGGIAIDTVGDRQNSPTLIGFAGGFAVAWVDGRNSATTGKDIYGEQLDTNGQPPSASTGFVISNASADETSPSFQNDPGTDTRVALVYSYYTPSLSTTRVYRRLMEFTATGNGGNNNGTLCSDDSQCTTGFCVDGYCCDTACGGSGNFTDCQTCSISRGGTANGTCTVVVVESICRNYADFKCDLREYCDGVNPTCPSDIGTNGGAACTTVGGGAGTCPPDSGSGPHVCM